MNHMKNPWIIVGVAVVLLFGIAFWLSGQAAEQNNEGVEIVAHQKGNPEARVVLTEFSDFQCPACRAAQPVIADVLAAFPDDVRLDFRFFPLPTFPFSLQAAQAAAAAGQQDKFFEFHDILFERQAEWSGSGSPSVLFVRYAEELELDVNLFRRHMRSSVLRDQVVADRNEGIERGVTGTPTFFLNGERMQFASYEEFFQQVARAVDPNTTFDVAGEGETAPGETAPATTPGASEVRFGL